MKKFSLKTLSVISLFGLAAGFSSCSSLGAALDCMDNPTVKATISANQSCAKYCKDRGYSIYVSKTNGLTQECSCCKE